MVVSVKTEIQPKESIMKILSNTSVVLFILLLCTASGQTKEKDFFCWDSFDKYREIKYWAKAYISVSDYDYGSGDSKYLNLCSKDPNNNVSDITNKEIIDHFNKEFKRLFVQTLPFHDTEKGQSERWLDAHKEHGKKDNFYDIFSASEEARRNALYGPNPGAVFCIIKISRRDFPVLYEIESSIVADESLVNRGGWEEKKLGYSTPDLIIAELKRSITQQLEELHKFLKEVNDCD